MPFSISLVVQIALPWKYHCLPLIFSYPHPVLIQQTFKGRPYRSADLSRDCPFILRRKDMFFKNKNKTEKPCHLNRVINKSFKLLVFLILAAERNFRMWGEAVHIKKEKAPRKSKLCWEPLAWLKTRGDNLVSFSKVTVHLVPLILVPRTLWKLKTILYLTMFPKI